MEEKIKQKNKHRPFHYYDGQFYFVSGTCYKGGSMFLTNERKKIIKIKLGEIADEMNIFIYAWVILNYHILFNLNNHKEENFKEDEDGVTHASVSGDISNAQDTLACVTPYQQSYSKQKLANFIKRFHSITSKNLNELDKISGRKVWHQYWDYCVRNKVDFWKHFNYILKNPLKHKLANNIEESFNYKFSSNLIWLERFGFDGLIEGLLKYKVKEVWYDDEDE